MIAVVDASVAVKWFLRTKPEEEHADLALRVLEHSVLGRLPLVQPPHFVAEVAAVLARLKPRDAHDDLLDLLAIRHSILATPEAYATALDLAMRHQHHLFDTLYHAVALHTPGAVLITADQRYYAKACAEGRIILLADFKLEKSQMLLRANTPGFIVAVTARQTARTTAPRRRSRGSRTYPSRTPPDAAPPAANGSCSGTRCWAGASHARTRTGSDSA